MDDLQRAQRLLNSPIDADQRKAIQMLAKSGDRRALAILRQAYDSAESAEIKQMALKGGAYLKQNLRDEVLAPVEDPITFDLPEDTYNPAEKSKPPVLPELDAARLKLNVKNEMPVRERKLKRTDVNAARVCYYASLIIILTGALVPWINLNKLPLPSGNSLGQEIAIAQVAGHPNPAFSVFVINAVLNGKQSPWYVFLSDSQMNQLKSSSATFSMVGYSTAEFRTEIVNQTTAASVLACLVTIIISIAIHTPRTYKVGYEALARRRMEIALLQQFPNRVLWYFILIAGLVIAGSLIIFLFDVAPRFVQATYRIINIENPSYTTLQLLDWGFLLLLACCLAIVISSVIAITSDEH